MSVKIVTPASPLHVLDGVGYNTFTTFANISPMPQVIIPQQTLDAGLDIEIVAHGEWSCTGTTTLALGFWFAGGESATATTPSVPTNILGKSATVSGTTASSWPWTVRGWYRLRVGQPTASGSFNGQGIATIGTSLTAISLVPLPATLALRTVTVDVGAARAIGVGAEFGASSASNIVKTNYLSVRLVSGY